MGFPATTRHYSCISLLVLIAVLAADVGAINTTAAATTTSANQTTIALLPTTAPASTIQLTTPPSPTTTLTPLEPPKDVMLNAENTTSFWVTWNNTVDDDVTYTITVSDGMVDDVLPNSISPTLITGKTPGQTYDVTVTAVRGQEGVDSALQSITLSPSAVTNLIEVADGTDSNTVTASWEKGNGIVTGYRVSCSKGTANPLNDLPANQMSASCSGSAIAGKSVTVTVTALSGIEQSDSEMVPIVANPNPVESLVEKGATTDSVTAQWNSPSRGLVDGYLVNCSTGTSETIDADTNPLQFMCSTKVIAGEVIVVTVQSISNSKYSIPETVNITADPNPVDVLFEVNATTGSVTAGWIAPSAGDFDGYELSCSPGTPVEESIDRDTMQGTCTTTEAGQVVVVSVSSTSDNKTSDGKSISITAVPDPVDVLFEVGAAIGSVTAGWIGPSAGVYDGYELSCSPGNPNEENPSNDTTQGTCSTTEAGQVIVVRVSSTSDNKTSAVKSINITAVPDAVADLRETDATTTSVTVGWVPPGGTVDLYTVECTNGTASPNETIENEASCVNVFPGIEVTVTISSVSGNKSTPAERPVRALPNVVANLQGSGATTSDVSVTWDRPMGELDQYDVYCLADTTGSTNDTVIDNSDSLEYTCMEITAGDVVTVTVVTVSGDKNNIASTVVRARPNAVPNLKEVSENTTSVTAAWDEPVGIVSYYIVECSWGNPREANITDDSDSTNFTASCVGLPTPGADYTMNVTSFSYGVNGASKTVMITAQPSTPDLGSPGSTEDSITVEWEWDTSDDGEVDYFRIQCENGTASDSTLEYVGDGVTYQVNCTGLPVSGGLYTVTVSSVSENKTSDPAEITVTATPAGVDLSALSSTVSRVGASWLQPSGIVDMFEVECSGDAVPVKDSILYDKSATTYEAFCNVTTPGELYILTVTSERHQSASASRINLRALPRAVESLEVPDHDTDSVELTWDLANQCKAHGCQINVTCCVWSSYDVIYGPSSGGSPESVSAGRADTSITVPGLIPGEEFYFSVVAISDKERSAPRNITQRTEPEAVGSFDVTASMTTQVALTWSLTDSCEDGNCVWSGFFVSYMPQNDRYNSSSATLNDVTRSTQFSTLIPGEHYTFSIVVRSFGEQSSSETYTQRLKPEAVGSFDVMAYTTTRVDLTWSLTGSCENGNCVWSGFFVSYMPQNGRYNSSSATLNDVTRSTQFSSLIPGEQYAFFIVVQSYGEQSSPKTVTERMKPEAVGSFYVTAYTTTQVDLTWGLTNSCENENCVWTRYVVSYMPEKDTYTSSSASLNNVTRSHQFVNLIPGEQYSFFIVVESYGKESSSKTDVQRMKPEPVGLFEAQLYTTTRIDLLWNLTAACNDGQCVWSQFFVSYTPDDTNYKSGNTMKSMGDRDVQFNDLIPGERYTFDIIVKSGEENSSVVTEVRRMKPEAVDSLTVKSYTTTGVDLGWNMTSDCDAGNCVWTGFYISYTANDPEYASNDTTANRDETGTVFTSLIPGEEYTFEIIVESYEEVSLPMTKVQRLEPEAVDSLTVKSYTTTGVDLRWNMTTACRTGNCVWTGFYISYTANSTRFANSTINATRDEVGTGFSNLIPGEEYTFKIIVESYEEDSSPVTRVQRLEPEPVESFTVQDYSTTQVDLLWAMTSACEGGDCVWSQFVVSYNPTDPLYPEGTTTAPKAERTTQFEGLIPGEEYRFKILVESGEERSVVKTRTQRTTPESVENFSVLGDYTTTQVNLQWAVKEGCKNNESCIWDRYLITYYGTGNDTDGGRNETDDALTATFDNLEPGDLYNFNITVFSYEQESSVEEASQRMRPAEATGLAFSPESRLIIANWARPDVGFVTGYDVTIRETDSEDTLESQEVTGTTATFEKLTPGVSYTVRVCSRSVKQSCIVGVLASVTTIEEPPTEPQDFTVGIFNNTAVVVEFSPPAEPNGIITSYTITYTGTGDGGEDEGSRSVSADEQTESGIYKTTIGELRSGYTYNFRVTASNSAGAGDAAGPVNRTLEEIPPVVPDPPVPVKPASDPGVKSFDFTFSSDLFSDCNGRLKNFSVLVIPNSMYEGNEAKHEATSGSADPNTPAHNKAEGGEYKAISRVTWPFPADYSCGSGSGKRRRRSEAGQEMKVTIGNGSTYDGGFTNVALHGGTGYHVKIRAWNDAGYSESPYSEEITTASNPIAWIIPLVLILIILVIVAGIFVWRERQKPGKVTHFLKSRTSNKANGGIDNHAFDNDRPMRRTGDDRPVRLGEFAAHLEEMSKDADYLFSEEYSDLRPIGKNQASKAAELDENKVKNRFSNILPYDHTRVNLDPSADEPGSDYINANYMIGYDSPREYIACQGPLQNTEEDMWRMVWEQGASLIVMVTQLMEKGKIKCHQYWPEEGEGPVQYGEITVRPLGKELTDLWVIRKFIISRGPTTRKVTHFNFIGWPDHGVPDKPEDLIQFVQSVRACKQNDGKPVVVHCSAGVGRTGTFISLDTLMTTMEQEDEVDIFGLVRKMRMNRCAMVQTETQYIFIHECINALLEGASEVIYENQNGTPTEENIYYNEALI